MRDQSASFRADVAGAMGTEDINFEDLLAEEPGCSALPTTFKELLAEGFPRHGGLEGLAAIEKMADPGPQLAEVRQGYLQILKIQRRRA
jgi:hypothetical protein